jgi:hypothetical protein
MKRGIGSSNLFEGIIWGSRNAIVPKGTEWKCDKVLISSLLYLVFSESVARRKNTPASACRLFDVPKCATPIVYSYVFAAQSHCTWHFAKITGCRAKSCAMELKIPPNKSCWPFFQVRKKASTQTYRTTVSSNVFHHHWLMFACTYCVFVKKKNVNGTVAAVDIVQNHLCKTGKKTLNDANIQRQFVSSYCVIFIFNCIFPPGDRFRSKIAWSKYICHMCEGNDRNHKLTLENSSDRAIRIQINFLKSTWRLFQHLKNV